MKKLLNKTKKNIAHNLAPTLLQKIDSIIEHKIFKPVVIAIITSFVLFRGANYVNFFIHDYKESQLKKRQEVPIAINIGINGGNLNIEEEQILDYKVKSGDTLMKVLMNVGANEKDVFSVLSAAKKIFDPQSISTGDSILVRYHLKIGYGEKEKDLQNIDRKILIDSVEIAPSAEKKIVITRKSDDEYDARELDVKLLRYVSRYFGTLKNGLYADGVESGISPTSMMNMINLYSYEIDFQRDIRSGDKFEMLVESFYTEDGKKVRDGNVLFSSLTLQNRQIEIYMHKIDGRIEYFDSKGNSVRKSLLRTPINGARVSSGFGMRRHPILGYSKMHKGIDFAASTGTPILAAGSGTIVHFGVKGGYGNYVQIKHNADYSTAYGHASRFNKKFHLGSKVKQGDVVAYVGTTGRSTGPHLHFELLYRGGQINPSKVKATSGIKLLGKEMARFESSKAEIDKYRKNVPNQVKKK